MNTIADMLNPREMSPADFAAMPALAADAQAFRRARRIDTNCENAAAVAETVRDLTGIELHGPIHWKYLQQPGERYALLVVHRFSAPITGEADLLVISSRYVFTRATFGDLALDLICRLGARKLIARIPMHCVELQELARRVGFRFDGTQDIADAWLAAVWSITPGELFAFGRRA
jgi:hypothetical protein